MKHLYCLLVILLCTSASLTGQDTLHIATKKVESMVQDIKKKELLEEKLFISEQQVRSFVNMDSLYSELKLEFMVTNRSQQESISDLVKINQGSSMLMSGIKDELKDVRLTLYNDNVKLRNEVEKLSGKNVKKKQTIVALTLALAATIFSAIAF